MISQWKRVYLEGGEGREMVQKEGGASAGLKQARGRAPARQGLPFCLRRPLDLGAGARPRRVHRRRPRSPPRFRPCLSPVLRIQHF
jgi:hypothetical protein